MDTLRFTAMSAADIPDVLAFWRTVDGLGLNESDAPEPLARFLDRNPGWSIVVRDADGRVVAAMLCGHDGRRGYLHHLATAPHLRRQGLGSVLVERCLATLAHEGIPKCNIFVFDDNERAHAFWTALGFQKRPWDILQRPTTARDPRDGRVTEHQGSDAEAAGGSVSGSGSSAV